MREIMINGTPEPIHFGLGAIREYTRMGERDFESVIQGDVDQSLDAMVELIAIGLNYGAKKSGSDKRYTSEDVEFMIDDNPDILPVALSVFSESVEVFVGKLGNIADLGNSQRPTTPNSPKAKKSVTK